VRQLPSGTVTFLFTDIEGSTRLLHELGATYAEVLAEHRRFLREACARFGGVEVDTQGDAFFVAFARASDAASAATEGQRALAAGRVRVRMGLHTGEPVVTGEGYVGIDVHHGARVMSAGHGGQVLVSQATRDLIEASFELRDLGEHRLKDLTAPQRLYQLGDGEFPPLKTLHQTNLPVTATPLIGRERELAELATELREHRVVTLVGPGGTGKTRLALQAAADAVDDFEHGVWWVPLAPATDPRTVELAIATAVSADGPLHAHLRTQRALLLLDNFEQIVAAAPQVSALLEAAASLRVLVTSREPLRIQGERRYAVDPLEETDAIALFVERARDVDATFTHDPSVAEICRRLEGLPLAVELAAARVGVLGPKDLLTRLDRALPLLTGGRRDVPDRQRTLRATIEWSHQLLDADEQALFAKLAVFAGGFTLEAVEAVCGAELDVLHSLVDKCLVRRRWGSERFLMLETVREFAVEQLEGMEERERLRRTHAEYFLEVAESTNLAVERFAQGTRFDVALAERENFRSALAWTIASGEATLGLRLATALDNLWVSSDPREGIRWFGALFENADGIPPQVRGPALRAFGGANDIAGDQVEARRLYEAGLAVFEELDDDAGRARLLHRLALNALRRGELELATEFAEQSLTLHRKVQTPFGEAEAIAALGAVARDQGDRVRAYELIEESASIVRTVGIPWWEQGMLAELAALDLAEGRIEDGERRAREALTIAAEIHDRGGRVFGVGLLARVAAERGELERAGRLWGAIETEQVGAPNGGWIRHRAEYEAHILGSVTPEFERGCTTGREWSLDEAVEYALFDAEGLR
jgi:predicted ATPase/class 3 adenylate cyclase